MEKLTDETKNQYPPEIYTRLPTREEMDRVDKIVAIVAIVYLIVGTGLIIVNYYLATHQ